jgi:hypothetical protein
VKGVERRLNWSQLKLGAEVGVMRTLSAIANNRASRGVNTSDLKRKHCETYTDNIIGAQAEFTVALEFNLFWDGRLGDLEARDVGGLLEVRGSTRPDHDLCLHEWDKDDRPYVSVLVDGDRFVMHGWLFGFEGKQARHWRDGARGWPAFWVPRDELHDLNDLRHWVAAQRTLAPLE